jgi:DNA-binding response OmpR family regulator
VLSPEQLFSLVWGLDSSLVFGNYDALRTAIRRLRRQLGSLGAQFRKFSRARPLEYIFI